MYKYKIIWSKLSEQQIDEIYEFYKVRVSIQLAKKIVRKILLAPDILIKNPNMGAKEVMLSNRQIGYRYIITTNYKIIYSVNEADKLIKIADVFDTRQNPTKLKERIK